MESSGTRTTRGGSSTKILLPSTTVVSLRTAVHAVRAWALATVRRTAFSPVLPLVRCAHASIVETSTRSYQMSISFMAAYSAMDWRYCRALASAASATTSSGKPLSRAASTNDVASRFTSHSKGPGLVSSKSLTSKTGTRSGAANSPKFDRWASPQSCTCRPLEGCAPRSLAMMMAVPR